MDKEIYEVPEFSFIKVEEGDVITASPTLPDDPLPLLDI